MRLSDFDYSLPKELIAQEPIRPRDHSRLLVLDKKTNTIKHEKFFNIIDYFQLGDIIVMNNSKVFPARLLGKKKETGGKIEVFLHHNLVSQSYSLSKQEGEIAVWQCLLGGRGAHVGLKIEFGKKLEAVVLKDNQDGTWNLAFNQSYLKMMKIVERIGQVPLPPYIKRFKNEDLRIKNDKTSYQTVYADEKKIGSVAAPTAGLHFTPQLIKKLKKKGVQFEYVTLHVGLGTFAPVKVSNIKKHKMHAEWVEINKSVLARIVKAKQQKRRIIAVGTTSARTLEAVFSSKSFLKTSTPFKDFADWVDIFIYPGYKFKAVDALITNFHLPKSTLLMLVSALAGKNNIDQAYQEAVKKKYRFFSYGDAMLIV